MPTTFIWERKKVPFSTRRIAIAAGFLLVALIAAGASYADAISVAPPAPLSTLVKFGDRDYEVTTADWVSLDPISSNTVRKIGYGRVSEVAIVTTSTGTYSSDGMISPHVRYPGISVRPTPTAAASRGYYWERVPGTYLFTYGRSPSGNRVFNALTPRGSFMCMSLDNGAACSVR
ncbi:hypothetical protein [Pelagibacterium limicola]|uniref:hypothetical protein n=1 Tax=Pelagibacterium limicola TaxID=2791022 RepID=UPI0018AF9984|nr:hypothetical protein [Pelagibacterium limicola]